MFFHKEKKWSLWIKCEEKMVGRDSLQCFWVNPEVADSFSPRSLFLWFFNSHRLISLLPDSSFCLCSFSLWLWSHFILLKIALWQIRDIRFLCFTSEKCKMSIAVIRWYVCLQRGKKSRVLSLSLSFLSLSYSDLCLFPIPTKCWNFRSSAFPHCALNATVWLMCAKCSMDVGRL